MCLEKVNSSSLSCKIAVQATFLEGKEDFYHDIPVPISHSATHDNCQVRSVMETNTLHPSWFLAAGLLLAPAAVAPLHQSFLRQIGSEDLVLFRGEENMEQFLYQIHSKTNFGLDLGFTHSHTEHLSSWPSLS